MGKQKPSQPKKKASPARKNAKNKTVSSPKKKIREVTEKLKEQRRQSNKEYNDRKQIDNHASIVMTEEKLYLSNTDDKSEENLCGTYFLIDHLPLGPLLFLLCAFMCPHRRKRRYGKLLGNLRGGNNHVKGKKPATYTKAVDIMNNFSRLDDMERVALTSLISMFIENCEKLKDIKYKHFYYGLIVQSGKGSHQRLHCDFDPDCNLIDASSTNCLILHLPLSTEGLWLNLGKATDDNKINCNILHVPFGQAVLLKVNQYHGGHYGSIGNTRLHFVMSTTHVESSTLFFIDKENEKLKEDYLDLPTPSIGASSARGAANRSKAILNRFRRMHPGPSFKDTFDFCENKHERTSNSEEPTESTNKQYELRKRNTPAPPKVTGERRRSPRRQKKTSN